MQQIYVLYRTLPRARVVLVHQRALIVKFAELDNIYILKPQIYCGKISAVGVCVSYQI